MNFKTTYKIPLLCLSFLMGCKTTKPTLFDSKIPISIEAPYFQSWVAGAQGGGSGVDVFLPVKDLNNITPDSLHFRGQRVKVIYKDQYITARFHTLDNQLGKVILSNEPLAEANNKLLPLGDNSPFDLPKNTCVLSYRLNNKRYYYKILDLTKSNFTPYPSSPPPTH